MIQSSNSKKTKKTNAYSVLMFLFGMCVGYIITNTMRDWMLRSEVCPLKTTVASTHNNTIWGIIAPTGYEELLLIGVMVPSSQLKRAKAIYNTWGKNIPGKILFFTDEIVPEDDNELPLVQLEIKDKDSPKSSFEVFEYMHDHYLGSFQYFMQIQSESYVIVERLEEILTSINERVARARSDVSLNKFTQQNLFCIKGSKVILSQSILNFVYPHFEGCLNKLRILNLFSEMDVGQCIEDSINVACISPEEVTDLFHKTGKTDFAYFRSGYEKFVRESCLIYPIPDHLSMYYIHAYEEGLKIKRKETDILHAQRQINRFFLQFGNENVTLKNVVSFDSPSEGIFIDQLGLDIHEGKIHLRKPGDDHNLTFGNFDQKHWNFISKSEETFFQNKKQGMSKAQDLLHFFEYFIIDNINRKQGKSKLSKKSLVYSYFRYCPNYGIQYIVDLVLSKKNKTKLYRKHSYVQITFGPLYVREVPLKDIKTSEGILLLEPENITKENETISNRWRVDALDQDEPIVIILPLSGRLKNFQRFIEDYEREVLIPRENVIFMIVLYGPDVKSRESVKDIISKLITQYPSSTINVLESDSTDSKSTALKLGTSACSPGDLIFLIDVDITMKSEVLDRIRWFTIPGKQVYYPIVFSEFQPTLARNKSIGENYAHFVYDQEMGRWRRYGFGMVSIYGSDLNRTEGFDTSIIGWGFEDVDLYQKVMKEKSLEVLRCPDPGLVHVYHDKTCDKHLEGQRFGMCRNSMFSVFASHKPLWRYMQSNPKIYKQSKNILKALKKQVARRTRTRKKYKTSNKRRKSQQNIRK